MENKKLTKISLLVAAVLFGGVNYVSFNDMGDNVDKHVVAPIKVSIEKNRLEKAQKEKEEAQRIAQLKKDREASHEKDLLNQINQLKKENNDINLQLSRERAKAVDQSRDYAMPTSRNIGSLYATSFGMLTGDEAVDKAGITVSPGEYVIYKKADGSAMFAAAKEDGDNEIIKGLTITEDSNMGRMLITKSGKQYIYENRCSMMDGNASQLRIITDSPSVMSASRQICSLIPIMDKKDAAKTVHENPVKAPLPVVNIGNNLPNGMRAMNGNFKDLDKNLDFSDYTRVQNESIKVAKIAGSKPGEISFKVRDGVVYAAQKGGDADGANHTPLNGYYNSLMVTQDGESLVYNSNCSINTTVPVKLTQRKDSDDHSKYFFEPVSPGQHIEYCNVLPLVNK